MKKTMYYLAMTATMAALCFSGISYASKSSKTDDRIESSAKQSYVFRTYLINDDIQIQSKDGAVTLTGSVADDSHKSLARETVASLPGVTGVDNQLELTNKTPDEYSDAWLITKVKATLLFHKNVDATGTHIFANDGIVTLRGEADSQAQIDLTSEYARDIEGVENVNNEMSVLNEARQSEKRTMGHKMGDMMTSGKKMMGSKMDAMGQSIDDASITAMVKSTLLYHRSTSAIDTTVVTKEGVVTLSGEAGNAAEKDLATKVVSDVHGVKSVINNMTIGKVTSRAD